MKRVRGELVKYSIILVLFLTGCGIFEPVPESYKSRLAETPEPVIAKEQEPQEILPDPFFTVEPSTWFGIVTTDMVEYVNIVTGETATGPSHGGYLDNHPDWEQVPMNGVL